jgi:hypothetical protein
MNVIDNLNVRYPFGRHSIPELIVSEGDYSGLVIHLDESGTAIFWDENAEFDDAKLSYKYTIIKPWKEINESQFDGKTLTLKEKDQLFIADMVYTYIKDYASKD